MVKRMSVSGDLNAKDFGAQKASDHFGTDDESANLDRNQLNEAHGIETVPVLDGRDEATEKRNKKQPSRVEDAISDNRGRGILMGREEANQLSIG